MKSFFHFFKRFANAFSSELMCLLIIVHTLLNVKSINFNKLQYCLHELITMECISFRNQGLRNYKIN